MGAILLLVVLVIISVKLDKLDKKEEAKRSSMNDEYGDMCHGSHEYCNFCEDRD